MRGCCLVNIVTLILPHAEWTSRECLRILKAHQMAQSSCYTPGSYSNFSLLILPFFLCLPPSLPDFSLSLYISIYLFINHINQSYIPVLTILQGVILAYHNGMNYQNCSMKKIISHFLIVLIKDLPVVMPKLMLIRLENLLKTVIILFCLNLLQKILVYTVRESGRYLLFVHLPRKLKELIVS